MNCKWYHCNQSCNGWFDWGFIKGEVSMDEIKARAR